MDFVEFPVLDVPQNSISTSVLHDYEFSGRIMEITPEEEPVETIMWSLYLISLSEYFRIYPITYVQSP
jgi:hypothetical protein